MLEMFVWAGRIACRNKIRLSLRLPARRS